MSEDTGSAAAPSLDEFRARAAAAARQLADAEAQAAIPVLPLATAQENLSVAQQALAFAEGPYWAVEHAQADRNKADVDIAELRQKLEGETLDAMKAGYQAKIDAITATIPDLDKALADAKAALAAHPIDKNAVDVAAQAVIDARAAVEKAQAAQTGA